MFAPKILYMFLVVPLALVSCCSPAKRSALATEKRKIYRSGLVSDFLGSFNPTVTAKVVYTLASGGTTQVNYGNKYNTTQTLLQPSVYISREQQVANYSVFFINFDNPNPHLPPSEKLPFLHWQESNLPPCTTEAGNQTQVFISSVPESVAENRYTFLIYREPAGYVADPTQTVSRIITNITALAAEDNLTLVGANYFLEGQKNNLPST